MFKNILKEFRKFAMRGNVLDMAVGIIIGAAFGKIVDSLVRDVIMPPLGILLGKVNFANLFIVLKNGELPPPYISIDAARKAGAVTMNIGDFLNTVVSFVIVAFAVFILVKTVNTLKDRLDDEPEENSTPAVKECPYCCSAIPVKAVRCPQCTADLPEKETPAQEGK